METVLCPSCGEENPSRFRLCGFCGTALAPIPETVSCPSCGEENPGRFRLCGFCGTALAGASAAPTATPIAMPVAPAETPAPIVASPPAAPGTPLPAREVRKLVTLVFSDLKDSTALTASIDAEAMNEIKARYFSTMAAEIERHGGRVEKNIGDAIMAVFGLIRAREDDALRAVRAAAGMQSALEQLNEELVRFYGVTLTNRTGVNTGEIVANTDPNATQNLATGDAVNVAARLEQNAPANEILIGEMTHELVRGHVEVEPLELQLKGKAEPVPAFRLVGLRAAAASASAVGSPFVGREFEMDVLLGAFTAVRTASASRLVTVIGDAGVGKTRLIADFIRRVGGEATVLRGRCLAYGDGITFWPLLEVVRAGARIAEDDSPEAARTKIAGLIPAADPERDAIVDRVTSAIGLGGGAFPMAELFWGARRLLEAQAANRPLVLVIDDIHWAEETFLEFIGHVVTSAREAPILIVCSARPELLGEQADWTEQPDAERIDLQPLGAADVEAMIERLLGDADVSAETREKVIAAAEGNPLYVEQMVSMLREHPSGAGDIVVPPTIHALLAARLDNLTGEERAIVDPASVIGLVFPGAAIEELVPGALRSIVADRLVDLDRKQFVHPLADADDEAFRFHHGLVRDAAYQSLLKRARATLHERFVEWAERINRERDRETEFEEILGYHLEQAVRYRSELGPLDARGVELGGRAAVKLASAGKRAFGRGDLPAAANLLRRATALLEPDATDRIELLVDLAYVLLEDGEFAESLEAITDAAAAAERIGDARLARHAAVARNSHAIFGSEETANTAETLEETREAIDWFESTDDLYGSTLAWRLLAAIQGTAGRYEEAAEANQRVIAAARQIGDVRVAARGAIGYAISSLHGPTPVDEALRRCDDLRAEVADDRKADAVISLVRGLLRAMTGDAAGARELATQARASLLELGPSVTASTTSIESAQIAFLAGDPAAADADLTRDLADLEAIGERYYRSTIAGLHARARLALGDPDGALASAILARTLADPDDSEAQILWRSAEAKVRALRGEGDDAVRLATEAVEIAGQTVDLVLHADALADLGEVLVAIGRHDDAGPPLREALALFERKGSTVAVTRVRRILEGAAAVS
ncbi:MAG TPA: AAA family ATPase [Candidatus Limnocylindrales bacterium]|nr:AAA family ATPase [Candidatus Limnocylindrales bacterium]